MHDLKILTVGRNVKFFSFYVTGCGNMWYRLLRRTLVQLVLYAADEKLHFAVIQMFNLFLQPHLHKTNVSGSGFIYAFKLLVT